MENCKLASPIKKLQISKKFINNLTNQYYNNHENYSNYEHDPFNAAIEIIKKPINQRHAKETEKVVSYLMTLNEFIQILRSENDKFFNEILKNVAANILYQKHLKNQVVFKYGERGSKYFIILQGKVSILIPKYVRLMMNEDDYIKYLLRLRKNGEFELLSKCINLNNAIFYIDENFDMWMKFQVSPFNASNLKNSTNPTGIERKMSNLISFGMRKSSSNYKNETVKLISETLEFIESEEHNQVGKFISVEEYILSNRAEPTKPPTNHADDRKLLTVLDYYHINSLSTGDKFGDIALDSLTSKRTASIIADEDSQFGIIDKNTYDKCLKIVNEKSRRMFLQLIFSYQIFKDFAKGTFEKKYYNLFKYQKFKRGDKLLVEAHTSDMIFFLKTGEFEIFTKRNLLEINEMIDSIKHGENLQQIYENGGHLLITKYDGENNSITTKTKIVLEKSQNESLIREKKYNDQELNKIIFDKKYVRVGLIKDREVVGLDEYFDIKNKSSYFTIECLTNVADAYSLPRELFDFIISKEEKVQENYLKFVKIKREFIVQRLYNYKQNLMDGYKRKAEYEETKVVKLTNSLNSPAIKKIESIPSIYYNSSSSVSSIIKPNLNKKRELMKIKLIKNPKNKSRLPSINRQSFEYKTTENGTTISDSSKYNKRTRMMNKSGNDNTLSLYKANVIRNNLYNNLLDSYLYLGKDSYKYKPSIRDTIQYETLSTSRNSETVTINTDNVLTSESLPSYRQRNKSKDVYTSRTRTNISYVDFLALDKFNSYYTIAAQSIGAGNKNKNIGQTKINKK
jgi:CRP-like cAMP-binding protein